MTKQEFGKYIAENIIYLDGATGSNLVKAGMPSGVCPEQWILEHRDIMLQLQKEYVNAGSNILYAPTFSANRVKLAEYGKENQMEQMITELVGISREARTASRGSSDSGGEKSESRVLVAGDLTMTGIPLAPMGNMELEELIAIYKEEIRYLVQAGVDILVVETMMSLAETRAALIAAREVCDLAVIATLTFEKDGRTLYGTDPATAAVVLESLGAAAVGVNCSSGPASMEAIVRAMAEVTEIPIVAKPNAGLPSLDEQGRTRYDMDEETFAQEMQLLVQAGASILGGCCGTTPDYIRGVRTACKNFMQNQVKQSADKINQAGDGDSHAPWKMERKKAGVRFLASERQTVSFGLNENFIIVGERINPTGKKKLQAALREGSMDMVLSFAEEQEACGAQILDINMGMSGIDEKAMMLRAIEEVSGVTNLPLSLDSSNIEVLEAALRHYPGRALINSISLEREKYEKLLPIAAKYGAMFILLPLSDEGLPKDLDEKKKIIHTIMERALSLGMKKEDIIVDGLVTTVGANKKAALETLETIRYCKEELELATICGLSNISFGMPQRSYVNAAFLTLAIQAGLTMAIANPSQELLVSCALATDLLLNKEEADLRYIEYASNLPEKETKVAVPAASHTASQGAAQTGGTGQTAVGAVPHTTSGDGTESNTVASPIRENLKNAVLKGNRKNIGNLTKNALESGEEPSALLNEVLLPAINLVGEYFDKGKYFLPQLIASAEAMKTAIEILEPLLLQASSGKEMPVVVIATVEGDIHDIGKNLVALMLKNHGFQVVDLGKDVSAEQIVSAAKENHAALIGLSALMTTTMVRMKEVVTSVKEAGLSCKVMIGGAVITSEYAREIGADGYSKDAAEAVKVAGMLL